MSILPHQLTVLMYHAIDGIDADGADSYYTVPQATFAEQLRTIRSTGRHGCSVSNLLKGRVPEPTVAITFDDGLVSNLHAAETLAAVDMSADFFVNPSTIEQPGFLTWQQLREMHTMGMSIQSHGMTHRYLNDLGATEVEDELRNSKDQIEQHLGVKVTLFAPPGGRMPVNFGAIARGIGYEAVCSSRVGFWKRPALEEQPMSSDDDAIEIPRLAVLSATSSAQFHRWIQSSQRELLLLQSRGLILNAAKRAIGNQRYERLRQVLVGEAAR